MRSRGFTVIELLVVIAIAAIMMAVASPFFGNATLGSKLSANANNLVASATIARSEAIKRNALVTMCMSADGANCTTSGNWEQGWVIKTTTDVLLYQQPAPSGLLMKGIKGSDSSAVTTISFPPIGLLADSYSFTVCRSTPTPGSQERKVAISTTGRVSVTRTTTGACS